MATWQTTMVDAARMAMKDENVQVALVAYLSDRNNFTAHKLNSALAAAGVRSGERERVIAFLTLSPKYGGGKEEEEK